LGARLSPLLLPPTPPPLAGRVLASLLLKDATLLHSVASSPTPPPPYEASADVLLALEPLDLSREGEGRKEELRRRHMELDRGGDGGEDGARGFFLQLARTSSERRRSSSMSSSATMATAPATIFWSPLEIVVYGFPCLAL
jgi:hypothetical protein